jgi:RNA polymerase-binding transcription factor DksA
MPESLTKNQRDELARDLVKLQARLEQLLADTEAGAAPVNLKDNQGRLSRMDEMHNQSILMANRNVTRNRLKDVMLAERRLADGGYGECTECGQDILFTRLKAYPEAAMCIDCKQEKEAL